jgi:vancomycin permeability regulator SanA
MKKVLFLLWVVGIVIIASAGIIWGIHLYIAKSYGQYVFENSDNITDQKVGVVLGAQVVRNSVPSTVLRKRLDAAIELYRGGKIESLVMSGDGLAENYNEARVMREYALAAGIPAADVIEDTSGLRTYYSCYGAKNTFNLDKLVIISQPDHVLRAVYICRKLGIDAVGYAAEEFIVPRISESYLRYVIRERLALINAWFQVGFTL